MISINKIVPKELQLIKERESYIKEQRAIMSTLKNEEIVNNIIPIVCNLCSNVEYIFKKQKQKKAGKDKKEMVMRILDTYYDVVAVSGFIDEMIRRDLIINRNCFIIVYKEIKHYFKKRPKNT